MPLIENFKSTSILKAFILNSLASSLIIFIAILVKADFDNYEIVENNIRRTTTFKSIFFTLLFTFLSSLIAYTLLYFIFGFGEGMLSC